MFELFLNLDLFGWALYSEIASVTCPKNVFLCLEENGDMSYPDGPFWPSHWNKKLKPYTLLHLDEHDMPFTLKLIFEFNSCPCRFFLKHLFLVFSLTCLIFLSNSCPCWFFLKLVFLVFSLNCLIGRQHSEVPFVTCPNTFASKSLLHVTPICSNAFNTLLPNSTHSR